MKLAKRRKMVANRVKRWKRSTACTLRMRERITSSLGHCVEDPLISMIGYGLVRQVCLSTWWQFLCGSLISNFHVHLTTEIGAVQCVRYVCISQRSPFRSDKKYSFILCVRGTTLLSICCALWHLLSSWSPSWTVLICFLTLTRNAFVLLIPSLSWCDYSNLLMCCGYCAGSVLLCEPPLGRWDPPCVYEWKQVSKCRIAVMSTVRGRM